MQFRTSSDGQVVRNFLKKAQKDALIIGNTVRRVQGLSGVPVEDFYYNPAEDIYTADSQYTSLGFMDDFKQHPVLMLASIGLILAWFNK